MQNKNRVVSLSSIAIVLTVTCIYFVLSANFENSSNRTVETETPTRAPTLVLGKELQPVIEYLADNVLISLRTTSAYHSSRLSILLLTWMQSVPRNQLNIVTDGYQNDTWVQVLVNEGYQVTVSDCPQSHQREALCCKSGVEYELYYKVMEDYSWFCHLDDDMYLNTKALSKLLSNHNPTHPLYLGYFPLSKPWELDSHRLSLMKDISPKKNTFHFATGATYCISKPLMGRLESYFRGGNFESACKHFRLPDDVLIGMVIELLLGYNLTIISSIKTHLQSLPTLKPEQLPNMVSVSYGGKGNRIRIPNANFSTEEDQAGFLSLHCLLHPEVKWCL